MRLFNLFILFIGLVGCGGSDSASEEQPKTKDTSSDTSQVQGMASLEVDAQFNFKTEVMVTLQIAENVVNSRAFLNVCHYDAVITNSETCFIRSPLDSGGLKTQFLVPHKEQKVKAEVWYYDAKIDPQIYTWQFDHAETNQKWVIN